MTKTAKNDHLINIRMPNYMIDTLKAQSKQFNCSYSQLIRESILDSFENRKSFKTA